MTIDLLDTQDSDDKEEEGNGETTIHNTCQDSIDDILLGEHLTETKTICLKEKNLKKTPYRYRTDGIGMTQDDDDGQLLINETGTEEDL